MIQVSVILPTYNRAATLPRAIDSMLAQTLKDIELIIVDDGSTDNTYDVLSEYASKDKRIKVIQQKNGGPGVARNTAVANASGKYIAFMDSDDACAVNRLELQLDFLKKNPQYAACACLYLPSIDSYYPGIVADANFRSTRYDRSPFNIKKHFRVMGPHSMMTRESFMRVGGHRTQDIIIGDLDFTLRYTHHYSWALLPDLYVYFYNYPSATNKGEVNKNILIYPKRHLVCYVSEWCRINGHPDPVEQDKPLEEILLLIKNMSIGDKVTLYKSLRDFTGSVAILGQMSTKQAKQYLFSLISGSDFESQWIEIRFIISLPFSYIIKVLMTRLKRLFLWK
ncbi:MAG: glycosyltransferase family 2 protein [Candidatus Portiera sp.]|nr:glycosyltransferase family 2 protein [Portiera sp.]